MSRWQYRKAHAQDAGAAPTGVARSQSEAEVSRQIVAALRALGFTVYNFAAAQALPPACAGFPDLVALRPGCLPLFVQVKRSDGGRLSEEQREFAAVVTADTGALYVQASQLDDVLDCLRRAQIIW